MTSRFDDVSGRIMDEVAAGATLLDASDRAGVPVNTARGWVTRGRRDPDGPYGEFVATLAAAKTPDAGLDEDAEVGPIETEVEVVIVSRNLDDEGILVAAQARSLAAKCDELTVLPGAAAGTALAAASRRLGELVERLRLEPKDEITELQERYQRRRSASHADAG
jgi:hypothetical protein